LEMVLWSPGWAVSIAVRFVREFGGTDGGYGTSTT
jgi:hypothetical protein